MRLEMGLIVAIVVPLLTWAVQWGAMRSAGRMLAAKIDELDRSVRRLESDTCVLQEQVARLGRHVDGEITAVGRRPLPRRPRDGE